MTSLNKNVESEMKKFKKTTDFRFTFAEKILYFMGGNNKVTNSTIAGELK